MIYTPEQAAQQLLASSPCDSDDRRLFLLTFADELPDPEDARWMRTMALEKRDRLAYRRPYDIEQWSAWRFASEIEEYPPVYSVPLRLALRIKDRQQIYVPYTQLFQVSPVELFVSPDEQSVWTEIFRLVLPDQNNRLPAITDEAQEILLHDWLAKIVTTLTAGRTQVLQMLAKEAIHECDRKWLQSVLDQEDHTENLWIPTPEPDFSHSTSDTWIYMWHRYQNNHPLVHPYALPDSLFDRLEASSMSQHLKINKDHISYSTAQDAWSSFLYALFSPLE